jgi:hypothetical protein
VVTTCGGGQGERCCIVVTALVVAVRGIGTRHEAPDLSQGRKQEDHDHSPWNVELNSERPSTGSATLRRLHSPQTFSFVMF